MPASFQAKLLPEMNKPRKGYRNNEYNFDKKFFCCSCSYSGETDFVAVTSAFEEFRPDTTVRYVFVQKDYKSFMDSFECNAKKPDIVAALNCGFVFYKEWDESLPSMVNQPLLGHYQPNMGHF